MARKPEENQVEKCPICESPIKNWRVKNVSNEKYRIDMCIACGYAFVNPRPSLDFLMEYYSKFGVGHQSIMNEVPTLDSVVASETDDPNSTIDARRLIQTITSLNPPKNCNRLLDVGCGYGFFSREAQNAGFDVIAIEMAENERQVMNKLTGLTPSACSFEEFACPSESVSVVLMSQILEHVSDVNEWISKARDLLVDDGLIAIALPNFGSVFRILMQEKEPFICPPTHLNFFSTGSLSKLLKNHGFDVLKVQWVSRLPKSAFEKRLPKIGRPILPLLNSTSRLLLRMIDAFHMGMIINMYAKKQ